MRLPPSRATFGLGALVAAGWAGSALLGMNDFVTITGGFIPARFDTGGQSLVEATYGAEGIAFVPAVLTPLSATFVHANIVHLGFNLLMLGFCGRFVELALGARGLVLLYLLGAYAGALGQFVSDPHGLTPMVGASGAISALLGAYALLFGERRGRLATHRYGKALHILWLAAAWIGFQSLLGLATAQDGASIAIAAHIGGFLAGLVLTRPLLLWRHPSA